MVANVDILPYEAALTNTRSVPGNLSYNNQVHSVYYKHLLHY